MSPNNDQSLLGKIVTLYGTQNFDKWFRYVKSKLMEKKSWYLVNSELDKPDKSDRKAFLDWLDRDSQAQGVLTKSVSPAIYQQIKKLENSIEIWKYLKRTYEEKTFLDEADLFYQLFTTKMKEGQDVQRHIGILTKIASQIQETSFRLPSKHMEGLLIHATIKSLPESYDPIINAISITNNTKSQSRDKDSENTKLPMNLEELQKNLIDYQQRHRLYKGKKKNFDQNEKDKVKDEKAFKSSEVECYNCGGKGHYARNCKKKKKTKDIQDKGQQNEQAKKAEDTETKSENQKQEKSEHAWMARIQESNVKVKWILDSGASQHMTNMKDWFEKYTILEKPIIIETASSTITAIGRGNIRMKTFVNGEERLCVMHNVLHVPNICDNLLSISNLQK